MTLQRVTSNEQILQRGTSDLQGKQRDLQRAASATSNKRIFQRVTSDFATSNKQRVKKYASLQLYFKTLKI